ncbi:MAG: SMI1/KNR4 family protein [Pirellulaceae bacterium]|nr:SMI1/KNR4 family protein [Pirellulaceae bacterium]
MTEAQLDEIEAAVGFALPAEYRRVAAAPPFRPIGRDWVYWFYDDPGMIIEGTLAPLPDGGYNRDGWRADYLCIGESAAGDSYVLDTVTPGLPVLCRSHETHRVEPEYPTFAAFVEEWVKAPEVVEANRAAERKEWRGRMRRAFIFVMCSVPVAIGFAGLVSWVVLWLRS